MYKESLRNLMSGARPCETFAEMESKRQTMPMPDERCDLCGDCAAVCPGEAISADGVWKVDLGRCLFCRDCFDVCGYIGERPAPHYALSREELVFTAGEERDPEGRLDDERVAALKGSLFVRELDTGSCNACEHEAAAMSNVFNDMSRFGIGIKASPRHCDALLVTGPMTKAMLYAARKTYSAVPDGKMVVACGTCAVSGGPFRGGDVVGEGVGGTMPVDIYIVGCPPPPNTVAVALVKALGLRH